LKVIYLLNKYAGNYECDTTGVVNMIKSQN